MNQINLPKNPELAGKVIEAESQRARLDRGVIGAVFGGRDNVPNNVAGIVALAATGLLIGIIALGSDSAQFPRKEAATLALSLVTLTLGFLFGRATRDSQ
ncbi:MAG TPA: hypothetical protein VF535_11565 [Allosphingosinicella sp.]|jgi:hypothetical protein